MGACTAATVPRCLLVTRVPLQVRLDLLKAMMDARGGFVPLPTILNGKTVDPQIDGSTKVVTAL